MSDDDHGMATKPHRAHHPSPSLPSIQAPHHTTVDRSQPTTAVRPAQHSPPQPTTAQALSSQESFYTSHSSEPLQRIDCTMPTPHRISSRSRASFAPKMLCRGASLRVFAATSTARRPIPNSHLWTRCRRIARHLAPPPFHSHSRSRSRTYLLCRVCVCVCVLPCTTPFLACLQLAY